MGTKSYLWYDRVQSGYSIRCHWKCDIVDTFTHHFCANGHGGVIGTSFTYIREVEYTGVQQTHNSLTSYSWHSSPSQLSYKGETWHPACCTICCTTQQVMLQSFSWCPTCWALRAGCSLESKKVHIQWDTSHPQLNILACICPRKFRIADQLDEFARW